MKPLSIFVLLLTLQQYCFAAPLFNRMHPAGISLGEELEVTFYGDKLDGLKDILFSKPGLKLVKVKSVHKNKKSAVCLISADKNAQLGIVPMRLLTEEGLSDLRIIKIVKNNVFDEKENNNQIENANPISLNTCIRGRISSEDVDSFKIELKQGQRLSVQVDSLMFDPKLSDLHLSITDQRGISLWENDDNAFSRQDPYISVNIEKDGPYYIRLRESSFRGHQQTYLIHVGKFERPQVLYPPGGQIGKSIKVSTKEVKLTKKEQPFDDISNPTPSILHNNHHPYYEESEPNNNFKQIKPTNITPPFSYYGIIDKNNNLDYFSFKVKKNQKYTVHLKARSIGSRLDSVIHIFDEKKKVIKSNDDKKNLDSWLNFQAKTDGIYYCRIYDFLKSSSPEHTYLLSIVPQQAILSYQIPTLKRYTQLGQAIAIPQSGQMAYLMTAKRENFSSELSFLASSLPKGVSMSTANIHSKVSKVPVIFEAKPSVKKGVGFIDLSLKGLYHKKAINTPLNQNIELAYGDPNRTVYYQHTENRLPYAIVNKAPFKVLVHSPKTPIVRYGSKNILIKIIKDKGFDEAITLKLLCDIPGVGVPGQVKLAKGKHSANYRLNANGSALLGKWPCAVVAETNIKGKIIKSSSKLFYLDVADSYMLAKIEMAAIEQGKEGEIFCSIQHKKEFPGKAKVRLYGLPTKAKASPIEMTSQDKELSFKVKVDPKTPKGHHRSLFVNIVFNDRGETITHNIGGGGQMRVDPPKKKTNKVVVKKTNKKPEKKKRKTRLEILREKYTQKDERVTKK